jgi:prolyl oligopeptidase
MSSTQAVAHLERWPLASDSTVGAPTEIHLPELGSLAGLTGHRDHDLAFFSFTSFTRPPVLLRWQPGDVSTWSAYDEGAADNDYEIDQVRYRSPDGTWVSMFLVRAATTVPGPDTPCILTGYGGFSVVMGPAYSAAVVAACDDGAIYAVANIRGGAEQGEEWHRAGMGANKQCSFDDFFAAADWLVDQGVTSRAKLAIRGGSNGGLLMGAAITQRPDLCAAAQIAVPLLDMVRFPQFLIAELWIPEYGDPSHPDDLGWLAAYSPYHRVVDGTCYPAVLLTTASGDSRVDPCHARKMAARLEAATTCGRERPILLREESHAGHGQGKPVSLVADELADVLAFLWWQLDVTPGAGTGADVAPPHSPALG